MVEKTNSWGDLSPCGLSTARFARIMGIFMPKTRMLPVHLNGRDLTLGDVVDVARKFRAVATDARSLARVRQSFEVLMRTNGNDEPIYGVNRSVGPYSDGLLSRYGGDSEKFNRDLVLSHCAGVGPLSSEESVRAAMLVRANMLLFGASGCQPGVVDIHIGFLNERICPLAPTKASVGETDINILAHVGRAMLGEGDVLFRGSQCTAKEALHRTKLQPIKLFAKDGLAIISSNAYSFGSAALLIHDASYLTRLADLIFALDLEAFDGNVSPFLEQVAALRGDYWFRATAARIRKYLRGSSLWKTARPRLQDPLSFRVAAHVHGVAHETVARAKEKLTKELNSSDDNPAVILDRKYSAKMTERRTRVVCTANFEPITVVAELESLCICIARLANLCCQRMLRLAETGFASYKFFADSNLAFGFVALQRVFAAVICEINQLCTPPPLEYPSLVGSMEDFTSHAPLVVSRLERILHLVEYILGLELLHASQAIDLRLRRSCPSDFALASGTRKIYQRFRAFVPFIDQERSFSSVLAQAAQFVRRVVFDSEFRREVILNE